MASPEYYKTKKRLERLKKRELVQKLMEMWTEL